MKIFQEDEILDPAFRKKIVKEIEGPENISRKDESYKRYEILKDRIKKYILNQLREEVDGQTVLEMQSRVSMINLFKKVVNKKARVYKTKPRRKAEENIQENLDLLSEVLNIDTIMKKTNRYVEAFYNAEVAVLPYQDADTGLFFYKPKVMAPHMYDVITDSQDETRPRGYILSSFDNVLPTYDEDAGQRHTGGLQSSFRDGDNQKQQIADSEADNDQPQKKYVWWGKNYHFTFLGNGQIVREDSPEDLLNPINELPIVSFSKDKDDSYWALGGEDLVDGSVLINTLLTDLYFNAKMQGSGLFYFFGKGVPKTMKVGPNQAVTMDVEEGEPTPTIGFASPNPALQEQMDSIEQFVAFLLTTNDLGVNTVQGSLSATNSKSGVHELIQNSEPMNAVEDDQQQFQDKEWRVIDIARKWHNLYLDKNALEKNLTEMGQIEELDYMLSFGAIQPFITDKENLENIEKRLDLGLFDLVDAYLADNPDSTREEAEKIILDREAERLKKQAEALRMMDANQEQEPSELQAEPSETASKGGKQEGEEQA